MKRLLLCIFLMASFGGGVLAASASKGSGQEQSASQGKQAPAQAAQPDRGEQVFTANCVRCHTPPGGMPQRITGTVVMHMRVRARLSRADEQALLRFLAP